MLREHWRGKESDRPQCFFASVGEVVPHGRREDEDVAWPDFVDGAVLHAQFTGASKDILRFLGRVRVPAKPPARLDFIDDGGGLRGAMSSIGGKRAGLPDRRVVHSADMSARETLGRNDIG